MITAAGATRARVPPVRMSQLLGSTLRDAPAGAGSPGHRLLLRGAFVRELGPGVFSYLPLGRRVASRIEQVLREEMDAAGGVEMHVPLVRSASVRSASGQDVRTGAGTTTGRGDKDRVHVVSMGFEHVVATLAASEIRSWRQLPKLVYDVHVELCEDVQARAGLLRAHEATVKAACSLDLDAAGSEVRRERMREAYSEIFRRCGLPVVPVAAAAEVTRGKEAEAFVYLSSVGEETVVLCDSCGYACEHGVASAAAPSVPHEDPLPLERVHTPGATTIDALADVLGISPERTAKTLFLATSDGRFVAAVVRGDMQLDEEKLAGALGTEELRPMTAEEMGRVGATPGYASPIGLSGRVVMVVDEVAARSSNLVAGANEPGFHLRNVNVGRDFVPDQVVDLSAVVAGQPCAVCGSPLRTERAVEVGTIHALGSHHAELGATYVAPDGTEQPVVMAGSRIWVDRLLACVAEEHHDERGLVWPASIAPFTVHVCALGTEGLEAAPSLLDAVAADGVDVLLDDRDERPGVKFADADLVGCPVRVTLSKRSIAAGGAEVTLRAERARAGEVVAFGDLGDWVRAHVG